MGFPLQFLAISMSNASASPHTISHRDVPPFWTPADCVWLNRPRLLVSNLFPWGGGHSPSFSCGVVGLVVISSPIFAPISLASSVSRWLLSSM